MNTLAQAVGLLALAALAAPPPPRRRLAHCPPRGVRAVPIPMAVAIGAAMAVTALVRGDLPVPVGLAGALAVITIGVRRRRGRRRRRCGVEGRDLADALEIALGELKVGTDPVRAFTVAAGESTGVTGSALRAVAIRARLGADVAEGMRVIARGSAVGGYWTRLAVCWRLAEVHGLPISTLMRAAQRDITDRQRFADRMDAALAGPRATAVILAGLPLLGVLLGQLVGARPVHFLIGTGHGGWLLLVGTALLCAGILWSDRIIDGFAR